MTNSKISEFISSNERKDLGDEIDLRLLFLLVKRNKLILLSSTIIGLILGTTFYSFNPKTWQGEFQIVVDSNTGDTLGNNLPAGLAKLVTNFDRTNQGLKTEVEKVGLPEPENDDSPTITIADKTYDGSDLPDTVKAYVSELVRANQNKSNIEYRLRQLDAARITFINCLKAEVEDSGVTPTED